MEVEIKIPITNVQYQDFVKDAEKRDGLFGKCRRTDTYYSQYDSKEERLAHNEPLIRIRSEENYKGEVKDFLTYKIKQTINGIENNIERETEVADDITVIQELFENCGFKVWWSKDKKAVGEMIKIDNVSIHVEYVIVNDKFYYVETEVTNDIFNSTDKIIDAIKKCVTQMGLSFEDRDSRGWPEIINGK